VSEHLVSVILPTFNRENTIRRAMTSMLNQVDVPLELIVIDDASKDRTIEAIADLLEDPRVRLIQNTTNLGGSGARNRGIAEARGRFLAFQDSDDEWLGGKLSLQLSKLAESDDSHAGNYTAYIRIKNAAAEYMPPAALRPDGRPLFERLIETNHITTQALLVRREIVVGLGGFDESLPRFQDWDLVLRIANRWRLTYIDVPTVVVYDTPGNLTSYSLKDVPARQRILSKWIDHAALTRSVRAAHNYKIGLFFYQNGRATEALPAALASVRGNPASPKYLASLGLSGMASLLHKARGRKSPG
jgi:glycosyltransferase involved in cell wall biosynthesis